MAGVIQPGGQGTAMAVTGTYAQTGTATFGETITGPTTPGTDFSKLVVSSTASLNGTLGDHHRAVVRPAVGTTFRILDASGRSGTFSNVTGIALPNNKYYNVVYDATGVSLVVALTRRRAWATPRSSRATPVRRSPPWPSPSTWPVPAR